MNKPHKVEFYEYEDQAIKAISQSSLDSWCFQIKSGNMDEIKYSIKKFKYVIDQLSELEKDLNSEEKSIKNHYVKEVFGHIYIDANDENHERVESVQDNDPDVVLATLFALRQDIREKGGVTPEVTMSTNKAGVHFTGRIVYHLPKDKK